MTNEDSNQRREVPKETLERLCQSLEDWHNAERADKDKRIKTKVECKHPLIFESVFPIDWETGYSAFRVCTDCRYAEEGGGYGGDKYSFLEDNHERVVKRVPIDRASKHVPSGRYDILPAYMHEAVKKGGLKLEIALRVTR